MTQGLPAVKRRTVMKGAATLGAFGTLPGVAAAKPRQPRLELVGHTTLGAPDAGITNMDIREDLALATTGSFLKSNITGTMEVHLVDLSDPTDPTRTATIEAGPTLYVNDVFFHPTEPWLFTANEGGADAGFGIIDVTDREDPELIGSFTIDDAGGAHTIIAFGDQYVITSLAESGRGIVIFDITDPEDPDEVGEFQKDGDRSDTERIVHDTQVRDEFAFLAHWDSGLSILDLSDPSDPFEVAAFDYTEETADVPLRNAHHAFPHPTDDICVVGEEVGTGDPGFKHVISFDLTTGDTELLSSFQFPQHAAQPTGRQAFWWTGHFSDWGVGDQADVLFSGDYRAGVQAFDLADPTNPVRIAHYHPTDGIDEVRQENPDRHPLPDHVPMTWGANTKASEFIYVSDFTTGVFIFTLEHHP